MQDEKRQLKPIDSIELTKLGIRILDLRDPGESMGSRLTRMEQLLADAYEKGEKVSVMILQYGVHGSASMQSVIDPESVSRIKDLVKHPALALTVVVVSSLALAPLLHAGICRVSEMGEVRFFGANDRSPALADMRVFLLHIDSLSPAQKESLESMADES